MSHDTRSVFEEFLERLGPKTIIVAPYIKVASLKKVLARLKDVDQLQVFTTWPARAVKAGVTDPGIFGPVTDSGGVVRLYPRLHGKLYLTGESGATFLSGLTGSANMTASGVGWATPANLELLLPTDTSHPNVKHFLRELASGATKAVNAARADLAMRDAEQMSEAEAFRSLDETPLPLPDCPAKEFLTLLKRGKLVGRNAEVARRWYLDPSDGTRELIRKAHLGMSDYRLLDLANAVIDRTGAEPGDTTGAKQAVAFKELGPKYGIRVDYPQDDWLVLTAWLRTFYPGHFATVYDTTPTLMRAGRFEVG